MEDPRTVYLTTLALGAFALAVMATVSVLVIAIYLRLPPL